MPILRSRGVVLSLLIASMLSLLASSGWCTPSLSNWQSLITAAVSAETKSDFYQAGQLFANAAGLAIEQKLPPKYLAIAICRQTRAEVLSDQIHKAEMDFQQLADIVKSLKESNNFDPEIGVWMLDLADTYMARQNPKTREDYLKHACFLKLQTFKSERKECIDCLEALANYYIDHYEIDKAVHILKDVDTIKEKKFGKNPDRLANTLNLLAINCQLKKKYDEAKQLELLVIKMANKSPSPLSAGLPAFYSFLGINALVQGKISESNNLFRQSIDECTKINNSSKRESLGKYFRLLSSSVQSSSQAEKLSISEAKFKHLIAICQKFPQDPLWLALQQDWLDNLSSILYAVNKQKEAEKCLMRAIALLKFQDKSHRNNTPELYLRLAIHQGTNHKMTEANETYANALRAEEDKRGFHSALVLFWWGWSLRENRQYSLAIKRLKEALSIAHTLPVGKRGTLLSDLQMLLSYFDGYYGRKKEQQFLIQQSTVEINLQRKLNSKLGPDFYHRM